ncbi:MAG TPA: hypothetical protein VD793_01925, partial [Gemmatimonadales bacterium]|nr:hypothetical protein [Gemmatimonadales bacterium]
AWYSAARSGITLTAALELGPDSAPTALQFDVTGPDARRVFAVFGPRRITVRSVRPRGEAAREYPPAPRILVLDDSVFALQALPSRAGGEVAFLEPRQDRRGTGTAIWTGPDRTLIGGVAHTLDRLALSRASGIRHLWFDAAGRLMKVEDLATGLVAERQQGPR